MRSHLRGPGSLVYFLLLIYTTAIQLDTTQSQSLGSGSYHNTPPVFDFKREWLVAEDEAIGARVTTVRTRDAEQDSIVYRIEPSVFLDGSKYFTINPRTGDVFLKESLHGQAGNEYYLYVSANDGHQTAKIETYIKVLPGEDSSEGAVVAPVDLSTDTNATATGGVPSSASPRRPFPVGRPSHSFPGFVNVPLPPKRPKNPYFAIATPQRPTTTAAGHPESGLLPEATDSSAASTTAQRHPNPVYPTARPLPPIAPVYFPPSPVHNATAPPATPSGDGGPRAGPGADLHGGANGGGSPERPTSTPTDRHGERLDLITAFLPLFAAIAFAPLVGLVFYFLHRRCGKQSRQNLMKSVSQKIPANKTPSAETTITTTSSELDYNGAFFHQVRSKRALSNRYEPDDFVVASPFVPSAPKEEGQSWEFPRHHLHFKDILGEGCFGQVWRCEALNICDTEGPQTVGVKTLKENASEKDKREFLSELEIMKLLDPHPNVVTLLGCCAEKEPVFLIMEFVPYGKLQSYLRDSRSGHGDVGALTSRDLTSFAYQIAKGMEYISSKGIIHRDLAARNVLVGTNKTCKIADFGFARDVIANHVYERKSEGRLPIRWMAPESLYDNLFTTKSDVWSFGILMWEIVTMASTPYPGMVAAEVMKRVREGHRLEKPEHCKREMYNIMFYCWVSDPAERPSFSDNVQMLDKLLISENDYIELERFPDHSYYNVITNLSGEKL